MLTKIIRHKNFPLRLLFLLLAAVPLVYYKDFYRHFYAYLTGNILTDVIRQQWHVALLSILLFVAFLIPLSYRRKANWAEYGLAAAFFVSLFVEMYGIPLTILFASKYFYKPSVILPEYVVSFSLFGVNFGMDLAMTYAAVLMVAGGLLILLGWVTLYRNVKKGGLVKEGIYSYSRHPQYVGFILIVLGWFIGWPTILTLVMAPVLIYKYVSVCRKEELEVARIFPQYEDYKKEVPFFI